MSDPSCSVLTCVVVLSSCLLIWDPAVDFYFLVSLWATCLFGVPRPWFDSPFSLFSPPSIATCVWSLHTPRIGGGRHSFIKDQNHLVTSSRIYYRVPIYLYPSFPASRRAASHHLQQQSYQYYQTSFRVHHPLTLGQKDNNEPTTQLRQQELQYFKVLTLACLKFLIVENRSKIVELTTAWSSIFQNSIFSVRPFHITATLKQIATDEQH